MTSFAHTLALETFVPMLGNLSGLLDKAAAHAAAKKFDPAALLQARLAPDMYPLAMQVQVACIQAVIGLTRLAGREPPTPETSDQTFDELTQRIAKTIAYLKGIDAGAFVDADTRDIKWNIRDNLILEMKGLPFIRDWTIPHFYFHVVTAYDIMRHNGVEIGKRDYMTNVASVVHEGSDAEIQALRAGRG